MAEKELPTPEEMQEMAEIDIRTVDTSSLVDIEQVGRCDTGGGSSKN